MKKLYLFLGLALVYSFLAVAMNNKISKEKLEGKWNVTVAGAPYGYRDYIVDIKENKGEYKADILFVDSKSKISDQALTLKDGKLTGSVYVDSEKVTFTIREEKGVVQGTAESPSVGTLPMTFTRSKD
ncbi:MAG: hypothetical protein LBL24_04855 [Bacteroidales bacterium]|jgi:hypothetical protein|nr:hypothetical protein [Bacteroidales bacterium]